MRLVLPKSHSIQGPQAIPWPIGAELVTLPTNLAGSAANGNGKGAPEGARLQVRPEVQDALAAFFQASALLDAMRLRIWDRDGLTVTQLRLLGHLAEQEGMSNAELADRLYVTRPSVSALLERLERGGYIRREVAPNDRRGICIWMEDRGREALSSIRDEIQQYGAGLMEDVSADDLCALADALRIFVTAGQARRAKDLAAERSGESA